jgi:uncharacterized protein YjbI with pentapeptide repeats
MRGCMTDLTGFEWPTCSEDGCIGVRLTRGDKCLAHAPDEQRDATLKQLGETGMIDARGVPIAQALLEQILTAAPHDAEDRTTFMATRFDRAIFQSYAWFGEATFQGYAWFREATFQGGAGFWEATFQGDADFREATFQGDAGFSEATFQGDAGFSEATFKGIADFSGAIFQIQADFREVTFQGDALFYWPTFQYPAVFLRATFQGDADFREATFQDHADFSEATFRGYAGFSEVTFEGKGVFDWATFQDLARFSKAIFQIQAEFREATFRGDTDFGGATFRREARFGDAKFEQARQLGPLLVYSMLRLDAAHFAHLIQIEVSTRGLSCQRTRFPAGVQFRLRGAQIVLDDADLPSPSILAGIAELSDARLARREQRLVQAVRRLAPQAAVELSARPRLLSVQGANVAGLTVSNVDLAECRFAGAHNLDHLRLETKVTFTQAPRGLPWDWRQVIAEERAWRVAPSKRRTQLWRVAPSKRWATPQWWPAWLHQPYGTEQGSGVLS